MSAAIELNKVSARLVTEINKHWGQPFQVVATVLINAELPNSARMWLAFRLEEIMAETGGNDVLNDSLSDRFLRRLEKLLNDSHITGIKQD